MAQSIPFELVGKANITNILQAIQQIKQAADKANLSASFSKQFSTFFRNLQETQIKLNQRMQNGIFDEAAFKEAVKYAKQLDTQYNSLAARIEALRNMSDKELRSFLPKEEATTITQMEKAIKEYTQVNERNNKTIADQRTELQGLAHDIVETVRILNNFKKNNVTILNNDQLENARSQVRQLTQEINNLQKQLDTKQRQIGPNRFLVEDLQRRQLAQQAYDKAKQDYFKANQDRGWSEAQMEANFKRKKLVDPGFTQDEKKLLEETIELLKKEEEIKETIRTKEDSRRAVKATIDDTETYNAALAAKQKYLEESRKISKELADLGQLEGENLTRLRQEIANILGMDLSKIPNDLNQINEMLAKMEPSQCQKVRDSLAAMYTEVIKANEAFNEMITQVQRAEAEYKNYNESLKASKALKNKIKLFFSATNAIMLFRRAIQNSFTAIKELDEVMTETAVVTNFNIGDMWNQLPEYTERANKLGVTIKDVYKASTLYYQQGLKTNEVVGVSNQTLKMARIAGLDAAEATNKMTAALRGFNMEVNEANAEKVSDVYSKLAAITASNVQEISSAMTKTASIASSAGMQFETTAAFLSQIIETTRESAETAGTALKTVIARFQELKKSPDEIGEVDGEVVDANKIETALKSVGVALRDSSGQFRELDEVFMELASKWDGLDKNTQRYIATIAAGSRQQSRFLAMMSNYARTQELVTAANNAAGASARQYEKTLESLETKLNKLKNAWNEFTMSIADNKVVKFFIDTTTTILQAINKITSALPGPLNSMSKLALAIGAFKAGGTIFNKFTRAWSLVNTAAAGSMGIFDKIKMTLNETFKVVPKATKVITSQGAAMTSMAQSTQALTTNINANNVALGASEQAIQANQAAHAENLATQTAETATMEAQNAVEEKSVITTNADTASQEGLRTVTELSAEARMQLVAAILSGDQAEIKAIASTLGLSGAQVTQTGTTKGATAAQEGYNAALYACPYVWILAAIAAVIAALVVSIKVLKEASDAAEMEALDTALATLEDEANKTKQALDKIVDEEEGLDKLHQEFENLTQGTKEWRQALLNINSTVLKLVENYPSLAKWITYGTNGELNIAAEGWEEAINNLSESYATFLQTSFGVKAQSSQIGYSALYKRSVARSVLGDNVDSTIGSIASDLIVGYLEQAEKVNAFKIDSYAQGPWEYIKNVLAQFVVGQVMSPGLGGAAFTISNMLGISDIIGTVATGVSETDYAYFLAEAGKKGLSLNNEEALKALFLQSGKFNETEWDDFYDSLKTLGSEFDSMANEAALLDSTIQAYRNSVMANIAANNKIVATSDYNNFLIEAATDYNKDMEDRINTEMSNILVLTNDIKSEYAVLTSKTLDQVNKELHDKTISEDTVRRVVATSRVSDTIEKQMEESARKLANLGERLGSDNFFTKFGNSGAALTQQDIKSFLASINVASIEKYQALGLDKQQALIDKYLAKYHTSLEDLHISIETFSEQFIVGAERFADATKILDSSIEINGGLSSGATKGLAAQLATVQAASGVEGAKIVNDALNNILASLAEEEQESFVQALNLQDWQDLNGWEELKEGLAEQGIKITAETLSEFINTIQTQAHAINKVNFNSLEKAIAELSQLQSELKRGTQGRTIDDTLYKQLTALFPKMSDDFIQNLEGDWVYIKSSIDDLIAALDKNTTANLQSKIRQLDTKIIVGEALEEQTTYDASRSWEDLVKQERKGGARRIVGKLVEYIKELGVDLSDLEIDGLTNDFDINSIKTANIELVKSIYEGLQATIGSNLNENKKARTTATTTLTTTNAQTDRATQNVVKAFNVRDAETLEAYANVLVAQAEKQGISKSLIKDYKKTFESFQSANDEEWSQALMSTRKFEQVIANATELARANVNLQTTITEISELYENYEKLADASSKLNVARNLGDFFNLSVDEDNAKEFMANLANLLAGDEAGYLNILRMAAQQAGYEFVEGFSKEALATALTSPELTKLAEVIGENGLGVFFAKNGEEKERLRTIQELLAALEDTGAKLDRWENPYDWLYNMNEKINGLIWERDRQEKHYQRTLKDTVVDAKELLKISERELDNLQAENINREKTLSQAKDELDLLAKNYKEFADLVTIDENYAIHVDYQRADKFVDDPVLGEGFEAYVSRVLEITGAIKDAKNAIDDNTDEMKEIRNRGRDEYVQLEQRTLDALVNYYQIQIDEIATINDTIHDTNNKLINSIQDSVQKIRQDRTNAEKEQSIEDKQTRLAYLQMDTSGANATEILKLQQEIDKEQESYTDTLIDQAIQEMTDANEKAYEQRQEQIEIMNNQLKYAQDAGVLWDRVETLLTESLTQTGVKADSVLMTLLRQADGYLSKSSLGKDDWDRELGQQGALAWMFNDASLVNYRTKMIDPLSDTVTLKNLYERIPTSSGDDNSDKNDDFDFEPGDKPSGEDKAENTSPPETPADRVLPIYNSLQELITALGLREGDRARWGQVLKNYNVKDANGNPINALDAYLQLPEKQHIIVNYYDENGGLKNANSRGELALTEYLLKGDLKGVVDEIVDEIIKKEDTRWGIKPSVFATGGLADYTGPAWLDGTPSAPELVLNPKDTQNFLALRDILSQMSTSESSIAGDNYYDINIEVDALHSDYDVEQLAGKIKSMIVDDATYRNVNTVNRLR